MDRKAVRVAGLDALCNVTKDMTMRASAIGRVLQTQAEARLCARFGADDTEDSVNGDDLHFGTDSGGIMQKQLAEAQRRVSSTKEGRSGALGKIMQDKVKLISNPASLIKFDSPRGYSFGLLLLRDVSIYLFARFLFIKVKKF